MGQSFRGRKLYGLSVRMVFRRTTPLSIDQPMGIGSGRNPALLHDRRCDETYLYYWLQVSLTIFRLVTFMSAYSLPADSSFSFGAFFASAAFDL